MKYLLGFLIILVVITFAITLQALVIWGIVSLINFIFNITLTLTFKKAIACSILITLLNILIKR